MHALVRLRVRGMDPIELRPSLDTVEEECRYWARAVSQRHRFRGGQYMRERQAELARGTLVALGLEDARTLARLGDAWHSSRYLEIELPKDADDVYHRLPWEYLIAAGLEERTDGLVVRVIAGLKRRPRSKRTKKAATKPRALYVECQPGVLRERYHRFENERLLPTLLDSEVVRAFCPTRKELRHAVEAEAWNLIHVGGYDVIQARALLERAQAGSTRSNAAAHGLVLGGPDEHGIDFVSSEDAAHIVARPAKVNGLGPDLVAFNLYDSALLAAQAVIAGASASIGFQDCVPDAAAEQIFGELYRGLASEVNSEQIPLTHALRAAVRQARLLSASLHATGVILYVDASQEIDGRTLDDDIPRGERAKGIDELDLEVVADEDVNFAMLYNGRSLFKALEVRRRGHAKEVHAALSVRLHFGESPLAFDTDFHAVTSVTDLASHVLVSTPWLRDRMPRERVRTQLEVELRDPTGTSRPRLIKRSVTLWPIDSWRDDDSNRRWLPSFVNPRDPAVSQLLRNARRHLAVLTDDGSAGFSGYQEPERIDDQARAIWNAILDADLQYVNPPPSYASAVQRIRSPSRVLREGRGTCIDLAVLYASCLEYVGIWPVLFLLEGHAFVGYWRDEAQLDTFAERSVLGPRNARGEFVQDVDEGAAWEFARPWFSMVRRLTLERGRIVPLEATYLASGDGFANAIAAGEENLADAATFCSMMDVWIARDHRVTPLPLLEDTE